MSHLNIFGRLLKMSSMVHAGMATPGIRIKGGKVSISWQLCELERRREATWCDQIKHVVHQYYWYYRLTPDHSWVLGGVSRDEALSKALVDRVEYEHNGVLR